jgi:hypothetical protein
LIPLRGNGAPGLILLMVLWLQGQPASLAISKLKWRRRKGERLAAKDGEDERGVTLCALTDDDERYKYKLEGDDMERIDETIASLERDESN